jgi:Eukaryotic-type carbonic anhydrase
MGTVSVFLQSYDDSPDYDVLNRLICAWREAEETTREQCSLNSVETEYPGCIRYNRGLDNDDGVSATQEATRNLRNPLSGKQYDRMAPEPKAMSAFDVILQNHMNLELNETYEPTRIVLDPEKHTVDPNSFDWEAFIAEQYLQDEQKQNGHHHGRELFNYDHVPWFNYFPMIGCRTEYYYRYSGTQTIPPCHGQFAPGQSRNNTNHWRAMKDPIRISKRQVSELNRLLRERIAPMDDPINSCQPDTAGKVDATTGLIDVARPLQQNARPHYTVFCECADWISKWNEDQGWCTETEQLVRFYDRPYNFETSGF